ncbi:hypothetical protein CMK14_00155 [Candidatus Poribacteria bacterium]|nr:hypothetical protein [Candidatus Poribacteria bacterium]
MIGTDVDPLLEASISPPFGPVAKLPQVTVRFTEPVTGVDADDLRLKGQPAQSVTGKNETWTFIFTV